MRRDAAMSPPPAIRIQSEPFDVAAEIDALAERNPAIGAIASFIGLVRDLNDGDAVRGMHLEHYPGMTEKALQGIAVEARGRWDLIGVRIVHRVGALAPCDPIVLVAVASAHRGDAFEACQFIMDFLKTRAPFWKKERLPDGARWVSARSSDDRAAERWKD